METISSGRESSPRAGTCLSVDRSSPAADAFFELTTVGVAELSVRQERFVRVNAKFCEMLGYRPEDICRRPFRDIVHPDEWTIARQTIDDLSTGQLAEITRERKYVRCDGEFLWCVLTVRRLPDAEDEDRRFLGIYLDITAQKKADEALRQSERERARYLEEERRWLELVLRAVPTAVSLVDPESGRILFANEAAKRLVENPTAPGWLPPDVDVTDGAGHSIPAHQLPHARLARGEEVNGLELHWRTKRGEMAILAFGEKLPARPGHPPTCVLSFQDITRLKRAENEMKRSNRDLELFASVAAHDLREPLRTMTSFVNLLSRKYQGNSDPECEEFSRFIQDGAQRMKALIDQLLEYSRSGRLFRPPSSVDCAMVLRRVLANLRVAIAEKGAEVAHGDLPRINGDESQLGQLFQNLILNAIKYNQSTPPKVEIVAERAPGKWLFSVRDNGIGIATEDHSRIFDAFQRVHGCQEYTGTGLGLAVCKRIVEAHGGVIWVESSLGEGAAFRFSLLNGD